MLCRSRMGMGDASKIETSRVNRCHRGASSIRCRAPVSILCLICMLCGACNRGFPSISSSPTGLLTFSPSGATAGTTNASSAAASPGAASGAASSPGALPPLGAFGPITGSASASSLSQAAGGVAPTLPSGLAISPTAEFESRIRALDAANQQLTTQLAQSQQQLQLYKDRSDLMQRQLADVSGQLQSRLAASPYPTNASPVAAKPPSTAPAATREFGSSSTRRSGARFSANVSRELTSDPLRELGYDVEMASDGVKLRIPSDQLFQPGSAQLTPSGAGLLDRVAGILKTHYSDHRIAIEGYTDSAPLYGGTYSNSHQLTSAQTDTVLEQWTRRNQLPASQFVTLAHGSNYPIAENETPTGRAANRRVEILVRSEVSR
jgi:flagellar motor protein MotB